MKVFFHSLLLIDIAKRSIIWHMTLILDMCNQLVTSVNIYAHNNQIFYQLFIFFVVILLCFCMIVFIICNILLLIFNENSENSIVIFHINFDYIGFSNHVIKQTKNNKGAKKLSISSSLTIVLLYYSEYVFPDDIRSSKYLMRKLVILPLVYLLIYIVCPIDIIRLA